MDDEEPLVKKEPPKWRNTKIGLFQFWSGAILTVISYLQVHALINSLALKWTFPEDYTKKSSFLLLFNLDVWEFAKDRVEFSRFKFSTDLTFDSN